MRSDNIVVRYRFLLWHETELEFVHEFVRSLKFQISRYGYGEYMEIILRDQFVLGLYDNSVRKMVSEVKLTFGRAVDFEFVAEQVNQDVSSMKPHSYVRDVIQGIANADTSVWSMFKAKDNQGTHVRFIFLTAPISHHMADPLFTELSGENASRSITTKSATGEI